MLELDQILLWVVGFSVHDDEHSLCVPDFSCCYPILIAHRETREAYLAAYMLQFDVDECRVTDARLMVERMNLRFLGLLVDGLGAWTYPEHGGQHGWRIINQGS